MIDASSNEVIHLVHNTGTNWAGVYNKGELVDLTSDFNFIHNVLNTLGLKFQYHHISHIGIWKHGFPKYFSEVEKDLEK